MRRMHALGISIAGLLLAASAWASAARPVAVSPGSTVGTTVISERCPTFSWGAVEGAETYDLVVYRVAPDARLGEPEELEAVLKVSLPGAAHAWTPSLARCLEPGGRYAWTLRGITAEGASQWSEASLFEVSSAPSVAEVEEALAVLRRYRERSGAGERGSQALKGSARRARAGGLLAGAEERKRAGEQDRGAARQGRRLAAGLKALSSETVGASPSPRTVTPPASYSLSIDGDFDLGGFVFKEGYPFLHNDGGSAAGNTALGLNALVSATPGSPSPPLGKRNTAVGQEALRNNTEGIGNTAIGDRALYVNTDGRRNTAIGDRALRDNTGSDNTASGSYALRKNTSGFSNTASGAGALRKNTTGYYNTAIGAGALFVNTTGFDNTASGYAALLNNDTGSRNTASGSYALYNNDTGNRNTASGYRALYSNSTGSNNTATGFQALRNNTGSNNTASGYRALRYNSVGFKNVAIGVDALYTNTGGDKNVAIGVDALRGAKPNRTVAIGYQAGMSVTYGNDNIFISHPGFPADNAVMRIGLSQGKTYIAGIFGQTASGGSTVFVNSSGKLGTSTSSRRFKKDIREMAEASEGLLELRPVTFRYKEEVAGEEERPLEFGLIAEEVAEVLPDLVVYDQEGKPYTVRYHLLSSMLLNELQKQELRLAEQEEQLLGQRRLLARQEDEVERLRGRLVRLEAVEAKREAPSGGRQPPPVDRSGAP